MSKISLAPDASGTGIFTIASPNSNTNRTLTLPDDTGTIVTNSGNQAGSFTTLNTSGAVVFNDAGADVDFRVEGDTDANLLFVDAGNDRVGIGTSSPSSKCDVRGTVQITPAAVDQFGLQMIKTGTSTTIAGLYQDSSSNGILALYNGSGVQSVDLSGATANAMKLDASGNLLVGTTGLPLANGKLTVSGGARFFETGDGATFAFDKATNTTTTSQVFAFFTVSNQAVGSGQINANGASQAAFGSFSDRRLKQNIVDLDSQWEKIKALRPVEFDYIESEGGGHQIGFIAQEVEPVYPDLVGERADGMFTLSGMGKNESRLIKALQEAIARIETLEAEVAALKGN